MFSIYYFAKLLKIARGMSKGYMPIYGCVSKKENFAYNYNLAK